MLKPQPKSFKRKTAQPVLNIAALFSSPLVAYLMLGLGLLCFLYYESREEARVAAQSQEYRGQLCYYLEDQHLEDVKDLEERYLYLAALKPGEVGDTINQFIIAQMPDLEEDARKDRAPEFCDIKGYGRPEPDPELPEFQDFSHLLVVPEGAKEQPPDLEGPSTEDGAD